MATRLEDVGLQVWQGCLLLCDFLLHQGAALQGKLLLELGGGLGLASIVASGLGARIFCTGKMYMYIDSF